MIASGGRARQVRVTEGMPLRDAEGRRLAGAPGRGVNVDPHVWGDPTNTASAVEAIRAALCAADPSHSEDYGRRARAYQAELASLDGWIRDRVASVPADRRVLVTTHDTLGYWADRYGFRVVDTVFSTAGAESADPSASQLARLSDDIRARGVPAVFIENVTNPAVSRAVAKAAGVRTAPPLFTDALGPKGSPGETYLEMMRYNAQVIAEALK
jgi:zinc/manganese transport system substrate-binding protein/manganese/iron transport system substrate-binding protein